MAYAKLSEITQDVVELLSQAAGVAVQRYAENRIQLIINNLFLMVIERQWWPDVMQWYDLPLDGVNGLPVGDVSQISKFTDIRCVFYDGSDVPMPQLSGEVNPYKLTASQAYGYTSRAGGLFQVWGNQAPGRVQFHARQTPDRYTADDIVKFDRLCLALGAAWWYLEDDATAPGSAQKFQNLFNQRLDQLEIQLQLQPFATSPLGQWVPNTWWPK